MARRLGVHGIKSYRPNSGHFDITKSSSVIEMGPDCTTLEATVAGSRQRVETTAEDVKERSEGRVIWSREWHGVGRRGHYRSSIVNGNDLGSILRPTALRFLQH